MDFIFKSFNGSIMPKRTSINKECRLLVLNKRSGAILWFLQKYPSQRCCTFVLGWFFISDNRHISFFIDKHTFQDQKPAARLITVLDIEFQSLPVFWNFEGSHGWPLDKKWPLKLVWYSIYHYKSYNYKCNRLSINLSMLIGKTVSSFFIIMLSSVYQNVFLGSFQWLHILKCR